ncbi:MAG: hypothetical protein IPM54_26370 [Polyangiaceae bacterium]|nr:hypothetical protein [Polyangiaceae bacterium]
MNPATLERLASILKREVGALHVDIVPATDVPDDDATLSWDLGRGRKLRLTFPTPPTDLSEKQDRLATVVESFADLFADAASEIPRIRPEPNKTLESELNALAGRAGALSAVVIDAASPIVWGASEAPTSDDTATDARVAQAFARAQEIGIVWRELLARPSKELAATENAKPAETGRILRLVPPVDALAGLAVDEREIIARRAELTMNAIARVRANPIVAELHCGQHLHEAILEDKLGYLARSFATIYVLILVFPGHFDELGAERAVTRALPIIERLVVALPPDDTPTDRKGTVVALRPRRK